MRIVAAVVLMAACAACGERVSLPNGASFEPAAGVFIWQGGQVNVPVNMKYEKAESDTFEGTFRSDGGRITIEHDIGAKAGAWAQKDGAVKFEERTVEGARVWVGQRSRQHADRVENLFVVTFPDNGCANFFIESNDVRSESVIRGIADSFQPRNTAPPEPGVCAQRVAGPTLY